MILPCKSGGGTQLEPTRIWLMASIGRSALIEYPNNHPYKNIRYIGAQTANSVAININGTWNYSPNTSTYYDIEGKTFQFSVEANSSANGWGGFELS